MVRNLANHDTVFYNLWTSRLKACLLLLQSMVSLFSRYMSTQYCFHFFWITLRVQAGSVNTLLHVFKTWNGWSRRIWGNRQHSKHGSICAFVKEVRFQPCTRNLKTCISGNCWKEIGAVGFGRRRRKVDWEVRSGGEGKTWVSIATGAQNQRFTAWFISENTDSYVIHLRGLGLWVISEWYSVNYLHTWVFLCYLLNM